MRQIKRFGHVIKRVALVDFGEEFANAPLCRLRNHFNVLWLVGDVDFAFFDGFEVLLGFFAFEVRDQLVPAGIVIATKVGLQNTGKDFDGSGFANTVAADDADDFAKNGCW